VVARKILFYSYLMVAATLALAPYAGWLYTAAALGLEQVEMRSYLAMTLAALEAQKGGGE